MGTNYYWHTNVCDHCDRGDEPKHIGKSSAGWCFSLHVYPEDGINDLEDWQKLWATPGSSIYDEYGKAVSAAEMLSTITERGRDEAVWERKPAGYSSWGEFHSKNYSTQGPRGLLRHNYRNVLKQGAGTWDCITGEFS
jgi:hypothetical protein